MCDVGNSISSEETIEDVWETFNNKQKEVVYFLIDQILKDKEHGEINNKSKDLFKISVFETLDDKQKLVVYFLINKTLKRVEYDKK